MRSQPGAALLLGTPLLTLSEMRGRILDKIGQEKVKHKPEYGNDNRFK